MLVFMKFTGNAAQVQNRIIWHSRRGEANHRGGNCQLEGHSSKTQDTLPFELLIIHILYEFYPGVLSFRPTFCQKILQTPTNIPVCFLLNKNSFEILVSGILSYGRQLEPYLKELTARYNFPIMPQTSFLISFLETMLLGSSAGTAGWSLFPATCVERASCSSLFSDFWKNHIKGVIFFSWIFCALSDMKT